MNEDIHDIAEYGTIDEMKKILIEGVDINSLSEYESTPLHDAISSSNPEMALFLLEEGADPSIQDNEGYTALHLAVLFPNIEIAEKILKKHPQVVNIESEEWGSPLLQALTESIEMVELLIEYGANKQDKSILHHLKAINVEEYNKIFSKELKDFVE